MNNTIETFYTAFSNLDAETMVGCYHEDILFQDPAFGTLEGKRAKAMWRMLCQSQQGKDFVVSASNIQYNDSKGSANWEAQYTFSKTGRRVHNKISAHFEFQDGLIIKHIDTFSLHKWATQAMGLKGFLLGGTGFFRRKLQQQTNKMLDNYLSNLSNS